MSSYEELASAEVREAKCRLFYAINLLISAGRPTRNFAARTVLRAAIVLLDDFETIAEAIDTPQYKGTKGP
jgi:hypothetical protein